MQPFFVYILQCADGSFYTGHTDNLERRLSEHSAGKCNSYTSQRLPVVLVFAQTCYTRHEAFCAERKIKTWNRKKKLALINGGWEGIIALRESNRKKNKF